MTLTFYGIFIHYKNGNRESSIKYFKEKEKNVIKNVKHQQKEKGRESDPVTEAICGRPFCPRLAGR